MSKNHFTYPGFVHNCLAAIFGGGTGRNEILGLETVFRLKPRFSSQKAFSGTFLRKFSKISKKAQFIQKFIL